MTHLTEGQITLGKTASLLGIIQGVVWFAMSLLCIIEYSVDKPPESPSTYMDEFNTRVYHFFLYKDAQYPAGTIVTPTVFLVFMGIFILLTTIWVVLSLFQLSVLNKRSMNVPVLFKDWAIVTWLISLEDFILVVLLGSDYGQYCKGTYGEEACTNTVIPVLVIAARGFVLWFVNVIVAWRLFKSAHNLQKGQAGSYQGTFGGIIPIYRPVGHIPRVAVPSTPSLYSQQFKNVNNDKNYWNVNLRTAMDQRTPPVSPNTPYDKNRSFKY